jgi:hypothetical protein
VRDAVKGQRVVPTPRRRRSGRAPARSRQLILVSCPSEPAS